MDEEILQSIIKNLQIEQEQAEAVAKLVGGKCCDI